MKIIVFLSVALIAVLCSCLMSINEARVNIRQDILAVYVDNTKDFVNFTDDFRFPPGGSKKYSAEEAKEFYHSELPKLMERRLGVWESDEQDFSDFDEWRGAKKLCLKVLSAADVRLELVKPSGSHVVAPESSGGFMTDRSIFLGPEHNGLLFDYVMASNHATYAYGPYGETVAHTGQDFDYRFSTKPCNGVLNTYDYAYRDYAPDLGRWLTHDPIFERGGYNLYCYCRLIRRMI